MRKRHDELRDGRRIPFAMIDVPVLRDPGITPQCKALYGVLISYGPNRIYPGHDTLAKCMGVQRRTVVGWLQQLQRHNLISWVRTGRSNRYTILGPRCDPGITSDVQPGSQQMCNRDHNRCDPEITRSRSNYPDPATQTTTARASEKTTADAVVVTCPSSSQTLPDPAGGPGESMTDPEPDNDIVTNLQAMAEYGVRPTQEMQKAAARPEMTPDLIHAWAVHGRDQVQADDLDRWLAGTLPYVTDFPPQQRRNRRGGHRKEGTWSDEELEAARAESLAEEPLDPDKYLSS